MKILQVHNYYQQQGGEDQVYESDYSVLTSHGHQVLRYTQHNDSIDQLANIVLFGKTLWNNQAYRDIETLILENKPDVCHFHNTFPLISPSGYYACHKHNIPVVQRLPNYRTICLNALLYRDHKVCENCIGKFIPWPGVWYACYRNSRIKSSIVATMLVLHRLLRTWKTKVDVYVALTEYGKNKVVAGGLPEEKIVVSPNIVDPDPGRKTILGDYAIYVGRLSHEKGLFTLLNAWREIPNIPLNIVGDGPLMEELYRKILNARLSNVYLLGRRSHGSTLDLMKNARLLIFPSEGLETFGLSIIEAYACGLPVIATQQGTTQEIVINNVTGLLFEPGNPKDLAEKVLGCWNDLSKINNMGAAARNAYVTKYSSKQKYESLMDIYTKVIHG